VLMLPVCLLLAGCVGWNLDGVRVQPLPENVSSRCPHPLDVIRTVEGVSVGSDEIRIGRLGDALIECGQEKDIAVDAYQQITEILR